MCLQCIIVPEVRFHANVTWPEKSVLLTLYAYFFPVAKQVETEEGKGEKKLEMAPLPLVSYSQYRPPEPIELKDGELKGALVRTFKNWDTIYSCKCI